MNHVRAVGLMIVMVASSALARAENENGFEPQVGQPGKDVVWVPTQQELVDRMLDMAKVTAKDYVIDLGSGDGRTVITAAKRGAQALGVEFNPDMIDLSKRTAVKEGVQGKAAFVKADLFETDLSPATVVTMFLLPNLNLRLRPKLLTLKPGTRVVSNSFTMEEWEADETVHLDSNCTSWCTAFLWIVPASVGGKWRSPEGELTLTQQFQKVSGAFTGKGAGATVSGRLVGDRITLRIGDSEVEGVVNGKVIAGTMKSGGAGGGWTAVRE